MRGSQDVGVVLLQIAKSWIGCETSKDAVHVIEGFGSSLLVISYNGGFWVYKSRRQGGLSLVMHWAGGSLVGLLG